MDAMSAEVDLARRAIIAAGERDLDTMRSLIADDFEVHTSQAITGGLVTAGLDGVQAWFGLLNKMYDELRSYPDVAREAPGGVVWLRGAVVTRAKGDGTAKARLVHWVLDVTDGKIARLRS